MDRAALDLLHQCELARGRGSDFPTIWLTILKTHPLVTGLPGHEVRDGEAPIVVRLLTGEKLASSPLGSASSDALMRVKRRRVTKP